MENLRDEHCCDKWSYIHTMEADKALELIMDEYGEEIKRFIFTYTKNAITAEDITQEVFVNVYLKLHSFNGHSSIKTWMYSIAINKCKDFFKSWHYRKVRLFGNENEPNMIHFHSPEAIVTLNDESVEMIKKILGLPLKYREILLLFYYREFSIQEISQILSISENTAKSRLHRGRKKLKDVFIKEIEVTI
ncbi:sigma-70 family RNA polymerase sigma factor [Bacillus sp. CGMCC 1.16607]|uniref:sigma-70 family RNA polymerase sigma factor n=1 Tax=Bacillus sp. CGMCC 1.16607 TaxID=3351842 RepID=UPI0036413E4D